MTANNLTISIDAICHKNCPYCISKMTFFPKPDFELFERNLPKAVELARLASVSSVLISSKGEPLTRLETVKLCAKAFETFPLEIQTNGDMLQGMGVLDLLFAIGVNTVAVSVDSWYDVQKFEDLFRTMHRRGFVVRLTIVLTDKWEQDSASELFTFCGNTGIRQITIRRATVPDVLIDNPASNAVEQWIIKNTTRDHNSLLDTIHTWETDENLIRTLPFGPKVYNIAGTAVTSIPYCIQEQNNTEDIRSLIYHQDGHMYTSWDKPSSILF